MKETNMEHYRGEIEAYMQTNTDVPAMVGKEFKDCNHIGCKKCEWGNDECNSCGWQFVKWLMSEYKPEPVLTAREKHFVEFAETGWLTRTEDEKLMWHQDKPRKSNIMWFCQTTQFCLCGFDHTFPFITWEDEEPWAVEDLRKLKALEYNPEDVAFKKGKSNDL